MTSNKYLSLFLFISLLISSCSNEELIDGDIGHSLWFRHIPAETLSVGQNTYYSNDVDTTCADLQLYVKGLGDRNEDYIEADSHIVSQIKNFLDPSHTIYNGALPISVDYTTEVCKSIRITLYDKDDTFIRDITDNARFYYIWGPYYAEERVANLLIDSNKKLLGFIKFGTTIKEYLAYKPMLFADAHFIFDGIDKETFSNGNYVIVEIELENGTVLKAKGQ